MKVYQIGNGKIYKSEKAFKNRIKNYYRPDHKVKIFELQTETTIKGLKDRMKRDRNLNRILNPNQALDDFYKIIQKKIDTFGDIESMPRTNWQERSAYNMKRNSVAKYKRLLMNDASEMKNWLQSNQRLAMSLCETVDDYLTLLSLHNYRKYKFKQQWDGARKYIAIPDDGVALFMEGKDAFRKLTKKKAKEKKSLEKAEKV